MRPVKVTFFGDSICVGQGISIYRGWVTQLARRLAADELSLGTEVIVTNASVNGRTTRQALEDMPYSVQSNGVDVLIVQFGLNDCNRWISDRGLPRVSLGAFRENIREIVERGLKFGAERVILNNNHPTSRSHEKMPMVDTTYEDGNREYSKALRELAPSLDPRVSFQDIHRDFSLEWSAGGRRIDEFLLPDGLHLNGAGHDAYLARMHAVVEDAVRSVASHRVD